MKKITTILLVLIIGLSSCNPLIPKELRKKNRCNRKLERVVSKCPDLVKTDTITKTVEVEIPKIQVDSVIIIEPDTMWLSEIKNDTIREFVRSKVVNAMPFKDTIVHIIDDITFIFFPDEYGNIRYSVTKPKEIIKKDVKIEQQTVQQIKLSPFEQLLNFFGSWIWIIIIGLVVWLIFKAIKIING